jgi:hypothetical protein
VKVLRNFFPTVTQCPICSSTEWSESGRSRGGGIRYRRCVNGHRYKVAPFAREVVDPGCSRSRIIVA